MIDIHSHILYGVDDGAQDIEMSLDMARQAVKEGITHIIATPHYSEGCQTPYKVIQEKVTALNEKLKEENINLKVSAGLEVRIRPDLIQLLDEEIIGTIDLQQAYMLIEFSNSDLPTYTKKIFRELYQRGITPIIVHPERQRQLINNMAKLEELVEMGAICQITAGALEGHYGKTGQEAAYKMLEKGLIHTIASDAHNLGKRRFYVKEALETLRKKYGEEVVRIIVDNTYAIYEGQEVQEIEIKGFWKKIFSVFK